MKRINYIKNSGLAIVIVTVAACNIPSLMLKKESKVTPPKYIVETKDTSNIANIQWRDYFKDTFLIQLIDTALKNNQELNMVLQEINISKNEVRARKGEYLPFVNIGAGAGIDKVGRYTSRGANDANTDIKPGVAFPEPLPDFVFALRASWELDVWKKLRNAKKSAMFKYLSSTEGKNFMVTNLVSEIASTYYELMALDNQLEILKRNIGIQQNALEIVKLEKNSAKVTELAVKKFEAEVLKNQSRQFYIQQSIFETENKINFLLGRFPQPIQRSSQTFSDLANDTLQYGLPSQLLVNRPDIRQAEYQLEAAKLDVMSARANFLPSFRITAGLGYQAFNPKFLLSTPESMLYNTIGDLMAPLVNRNAIKATYFNAGSKQVQMVYNYQKSVLNAYIEVVNQVSNIENLRQSYDLKDKQVQALTQSIDISTVLFRSARADYMEVLMTQRDALDSRFELIDTKLQQLIARVSIYKALGGGWK